MAFTPDKPENKEDLVCFYDTELNEQAFLMYENESEVFYRNNGEWVAIQDSDKTQPDLDGLIMVYVDPAFTPVYDEAQKANEAMSLEEVEQYESAE